MSPSSAARAARRSTRRPVAMTRWPSFTKRRAKAAPKPAVAPVTSIVFIAHLLDLAGPDIGQPAGLGKQDGLARAQGFGDGGDAFRDAGFVFDDPRTILAGEHLAQEFGLAG